jgi:hypothetical protein
MLSHVLTWLLGLLHSALFSRQYPRFRRANHRKTVLPKIQKTAPKSINSAHDQIMCYECIASENFAGDTVVGDIPRRRERSNGSIQRATAPTHCVVQRSRPRARWWLALGRC